jgi:cobalamin biosynthesis protein CbiM
VHIPDGFIDAPTSAVAGVVAAAGVAVALRGARTHMDERLAPLAGLTTVFIFAVQMLNFPVAAGTSGHLIGAALATVLVGPWAASLSMTIVLVVQAFLFADGGLSALGLNVFNLSIVAVVAAHLLFVGVRALLPRRKSSVIAAAAVAAWLSVPVSAAAFTLQYWIGGEATYSVGSVLGAMLSTHALIGIGEAVITGLALGTVLSSRSDLVSGWRPEPRRAPGAMAA